MAKITWKIGSQIGEPGGFGQVYNATKLLKGIKQSGEYAVKELIQTDEESIERFKREVNYLKVLEHPRIIKCEGSKLSSEPFFYTMKKYKTSLTNIQPELSKDLRRLKILYNCILEGLEYLHYEGYYHRDLKLGNVLLNNDNDLVLCDLGLCVNPLTEREARLTKTFQTIGSDYYCSPEQKNSLKNVDHRTDIYSFGKMLYEALTNTKPSVLDISSVPVALQYVVRKCTEDQRAERFDSIEALKRKFNLGMDLLTDSENDTDLLELINELNNFEEFDFVVDNTKIGMLAQEISKIDDDQELHELIMKIDADVISHLIEEHPETVNKALRKFIIFTGKQGWPFSYTDSLAKKYKEIFLETNDINLREAVLKSLLEVGVNHNRWYVMGVFVDTLYYITKESEAYSIYHSLIEEQDDLNRVSRNVDLDKKKMHPMLGKLFQLD